MSCEQAAWPALPLVGVHHVAIIASDYARSRRFYTEVLGLQVVHEHYRAERQSYKLDLQLPDGTQVELFSFPHPPPRPSYPEACGLRHLALRVADMEAGLAALAAHGIAVEPVRTDPFTGALFTFFADPDGLPIELVGPVSVPR
ncbi:glyoxylase I family protein [Acidovorax sp. 69]|uniref:SMU1112c/YaeR family gloxylase I-like metalloprotein n=1 Tax=Acidovorax sp. 69 TaxID=2035202 RepID=UPI000C2441F5|nr:VOC family protein [Acidovorax sp. 69]PJI99028.1 glyoxylase I family protein [Acidovorax sp. 69]